MSASDSDLPSSAAAPSLPASASSSSAALIGPSSSLLAAPAAGSTPSPPFSAAAAGRQAASDATSSDACLSVRLPLRVKARPRTCLPPVPSCSSSLPGLTTIERRWADDRRLLARLPRLEAGSSVIVDETRWCEAGSASAACVCVDSCRSCRTAPAVSSHCRTVALCCSLLTDSACSVRGRVAPAQLRHSGRDARQGRRGDPEQRGEVPGARRVLQLAQQLFRRGLVLHLALRLEHNLEHRQHSRARQVGDALRGPRGRPYAQPVLPPGQLEPVQRRRELRRPRDRRALQRHAGRRRLIRARAAGVCGRSIDGAQRGGGLGLGRALPGMLRVGWGLDEPQRQRARCVELLLHGSGF
eukprot:scaffold20852_cov90-Isochrysis_galbana.AAC.2